MAKIFSRLPTLPLAAGLIPAHPLALPEVAHIDDPAFSVMFDFKYTQAAAIGPEAGIDDALREMKAINATVLLVADTEHKVLGLISSEDILGEKPVKLIQERRMPRSDISVQMVMQPQANVIAINFDDLRHAKVGDVIETLNDIKQHYALVVKIDDTSHKQCVRGLFSISQISKQLGQDVSSDLTEAHSIAELQHHLREN